MNLRAEFLVGKIIENEWSGVYGYKPEEPELFERFGEIYLVARLKTDTKNINLERVAKLIIDKLQEAYLSETKKYDSLLLRLEGSLWAMKSRMEDILSRENELAKKGLDFEMAVIAVREDNLYAAVVGESKIYIFRDGEFAEISGALVDANHIGFVKTGSLKLDLHDRIALVTSRSLTYIGEENTKEGLSNLDLNIFKIITEQVGSSILFLVEDNLEWNPIIQEEIKETPNNLESGFEGPVELTEEDDIDEDDAQENEKLGLLKDRLKVGKDKFLTTFAAYKSLAVEKFNNLKKRKTEKVNDLFVEGSESTIHKSFSETKEDNDYEYEYVDSPSIIERVKTGLGSFVNFVNKNIFIKISNHFKDNKTTYAHIVNTVVKKLKNISLTTWKYLKFQFVGTGDRRDIYLRAQRLKRNRRLLVIAIIIFGIIFYFGYKEAQANSRERKRVNAAETRVVEFNNQLQVLTNQVDTAKNETEAKKILITNELAELYQKVETQKREGLFVEELNKILENIVLQEDELMLREVVTQPQIVADISKVFADSKLSDLEYSNGFLYVSDANRGVVYRIGTNIDSPIETQASGLTKPAILERNVSGNIIVFDEDAGSSIGFINVNQLGSFERYPSLPQTSIGKVNEAAIFSGNDALYEIHQNHQQIFKREKTGNAYGGGGVTYLTGNPPNWKTDPELASAIDIEAPYEIYALIKGKGVRRYLGGGNNTITFEETFENLLRSDFDAMSSATAIDVTKSFLAVAVNQTGNNRILLFQIKDTDQKELVYVKQFVYRGSDQDIFSNVEEIILNEESRKMYVLSGQKVVRLDF